MTGPRDRRSRPGWRPAPAPRREAVLEGRTVLGLQPLREAIRARHLRRLLALEGGGPQVDALVRFAADQGVAVERVTRPELERLAHGGRHQGAIGEASALVVHELDGLDLGADALLVALDGVTDPQNFGAVIRSAVALGSGEVLFGESGAAPLTPATFRASAGAVEHAVLVRVSSLRSAATALQARGVRVVALDAAGTVLLSEVDLRGPTAVVVGAEDRGVARAVRQAADVCARLPMSGRVGSLNASVAAALALYEARRQRGSASGGAPSGGEPDAPT